ncbi:MAG: PAS domain S-box protein [Deltaproteobacteria bacterium]|nr:PAS domain S-box protein [Deltaproteobacteria bacterium]
MSPPPPRSASLAAPRFLARILTLAIITVVLMVSSVVITVNYVYNSDQALRAVRQQADLYIAYLQKGLEVPLWTMNEEVARAIAAAFSQNRGVLSLLVTDSEGRVVFHLARSSPKSGLTREAVISHQGRVLGHVVLTLSLSEYARENHLLLVGSVITVLAVVLTLLGATGLLLGRLLKRPLAALVRSIDALGRGDYAAVPEDVRYLELEDILARFNRMARQVQRREESLRQANQRLQEQIQERRKAQAARRESEERYRRLFDNITDLIYTHDLEGRLLAVNRAAAERLETPAEELAGRSLADFMPPELRPTYFQEYLPGVAREGHYSGMGKYFTAGGRELYVEYHSVLVREQGRPSYVSGSARDVTERFKAEKALRKLEEELHQARKMEAVGTLASGIAHDFNNVLQLVLANVQLLESGDLGDGPAAAKRLADISAALERAAGTVARLLTFSRKSLPHKQAVDLNHLVRETVGLLSHTLPPMIEIKTLLTPDLPAIMGDPNQLEQVLLNLASNARDAMGQVGRLTLATSLVEPDHEILRTAPDLRPGSYLRLTVTDTGTGMDAETRQHIFEPFFTTKEVGSGTGLGLATVYGIVKEHGGHIICHSQPGQGASFDILFPMEPEATATAAGPAPALTDEALQGREKIILVDDEPSILATNQDILSQFGYDTVTAGSGEEALAIFRREPGAFDLAILDLGMPGMGGMACLEEMRRLAPGLKVIIASGYGLEAAPSDLAARTGAALLPKPYPLLHLVRLVRRVLES